MQDIEERHSIKCQIKLEVYEEKIFQISMPLTGN
jgi:hypothetical protein